MAIGKKTGDRKKGSLNKAKPAEKAGRPSPYKPEFIEQARKLCELGATNVELADFFEVTPPTITAWMHAHPEFFAALKVGKAALDDRVERSLAHRALGYSFDAEKIFCSKDGVVTRVPYREHAAPDTTACIFWLKNRRREQWRDRQEHEHSGPGGEPVRFVIENAPAMKMIDVTPEPA